jgi:hypothetical protein
MKEKHIPKNNVKEEHKTQQQCKERAQVQLTMQMKSMRLNNSAKKSMGPKNKTNEKLKNNEHKGRTQNNKEKEKTQQED